MSEAPGSEQGTRRETFSRLTQVNLVITIFGVMILATPILFVFTAIGQGMDAVRLGLVIMLAWLFLIICSLIFAKQARRHGYLGK